MRLLPAVALAVALAVVLAVVPGCSSDDDPKPDASTALPSDADLATYFGAVASYDPGRLADAQEIAADGSPAQGYAAYLAEFASSRIAGGQPVPAAEAEEVNGGFRACGGSGAADECATWADLAGADGKLTSFTVNDVSLDDSLVDLTDQPPIQQAGLYTVQPDWAYRSPQSGTLFVLVTVTAGDVPLRPRPGLYASGSVFLKGVPGLGPATVEPGASAPAILAFPEAQEATLDGQVTFELGLGWQTSESIGFGLTPPAV